MAQKYDVQIAGDWVKCKRAMPVKRGWLHYDLKDGTNGLARPGKWRERPAKAVK